MIGAMLRSGWLSLRRDYVVLGLTFVLPVVFFSIFAGVFSSFGGGGGGGGMSDVEVAVVDRDDSATSRRLVRALQDNGSLDVRLGPADGARYDRDQAEALVKEGDVHVAIVIPPGFGDSFGTFAPGAAAIELLADTVADPVSHRMVSGLLQGVVMTAMPDVMMERGLDQFDRFVGMTDDQKRQIDGLRAAIDEEPEGSGAKTAMDGFSSGLVNVETIDVAAPTGGESADSRKRVVAFYAAAIGVMFLLFSMAGAMGSLLEEQRTGTLERLLNTNLGMGRLLLSYWLFAALMGFAQLSVMFVWGWAVFGLELWTVRHVAGFVVMTAVASAAAAGFGMMLGTLCRSEGQLRGISTIVILVMSAVGGSMFPRFLMPEAMQTAGLATFNGWAIDGYQKVFHHNETVLALWPQVLALAAMAAAFLVIARLSARRWETA